MWFVYILLCTDDSLYTGCTNNIEKRFSEHSSGKGGRYTRSHKPVDIVYKESFHTKSEALKRECEIKKWRKSEKVRMIQTEILIPPSHSHTPQL